MNDKQFRMLMTVIFAIADVLIFGGTKGRATILLAIDDFKVWEEEKST